MAKKASKSTRAVTTTRTVTVKKATNGYTISTWKDDKNVLKIAKTKAEAMDVAKKMFNSR